MRTRIGLAPLIDVVFLLLIFFLLTSTFVTPQGLDVILPRSATAAPSEPASLIVVLEPDGSIIVDGRTTTVRELPNTLRQALARDPERRVSVRADADARVQALVAVVDGLRAAGVHELDIMSDPSMNQRGNR